MSAVAEGLVGDPNPSSASVVVVEVAPKIPSSLFGCIPVPECPALLRGLVHEGHVVPVVELCELRVGAEIPFAELVSDLVAGDV